MRRPVAPPARTRSRTGSIVAPVRGLFLDQSPADPTLGTAEVLDNWIPTNRGVRVRGGLLKSATTGGDGVTCLFAYNHPTAAAIFAATQTAVYNISNLNPDETAPVALPNMSSGYFSTAQIGTVGGEYLCAVNGADPAKLFDGGTWSDAAVTFEPATTGVTTSDFSAVWLYRNRLFFVEKDTANAWYLNVDSIGGTARSVSLAGVFQRGGALLFGATWSLDSGDGLDDKCVFISTSGEVAIYEGADPSSTTGWHQVGRYDVAKPLGINGIMHIGGDLLIATVEGIVPLSEVLQKDPAALSLSAVTRPIESLWTHQAQRATQPIELGKWSDRGLGVVALPEASFTLLVNLQTGGWCKATGWVATCVETFLGKAYIGRSDGYILAIDETGRDVEAPYTARYCGGFEDFGAADYKNAQQMRCVFYASQDFHFKTGIAADFEAEVFEVSPDYTDLPRSEEYLIWGSGLWGEKLWWSEAVVQPVKGITSQWIPVSGTGHVLAPQVQVTSGSSTKPNIELIRCDLSYEVGGVVV